MVSVWNRSKEHAREWGEHFNIPWYTDIRKLIDEKNRKQNIIIKKLLEKNILKSVIAYTTHEDNPLTAWENPFYKLQVEKNLSWGDMMISIAGCVKKTCWMLFFTIESKYTDLNRHGWTGCWKQQLENQSAFFKTGWNEPIVAS